MSLLYLLPCLDSDEMAEARRRELSIPPDTAAEFGRSAVEATGLGHYVTQDRDKVDLTTGVEAACAAKRSIAPEAELPNHERDSFPKTRIQVANETTLGASRRFVESGHKPLALNFANGVNPGGGFLMGANGTGGDPVPVQRLVPNHR